MSLLDSAYESFAMVNKTAVSDEYGGFKPSWQIGSVFQAAVTFDNSLEARVAAVNGVRNLYKIITRKDVTLNYHDVVKRLSDGKYFRVTSDGTDKKTPKPATLNMRVVSAEEWRLTDEQS